MNNRNAALKTVRAIQLQIASLEASFVAFDEHLNGDDRHDASIAKVIHTAYALVDVMHSLDARRTRQAQKGARVAGGGGHSRQPLIGVAGTRKAGGLALCVQHRITTTATRQQIIEQRRVALAFNRWRQSMWNNVSERERELATPEGYSSFRRYAAYAPSSLAGSTDSRDKSASFRDSLDAEDERDEEDEEENYDEEQASAVIFDAGTGAPISLAQLWGANHDHTLNPVEVEAAPQKPHHLPVSPVQRSYDALAAEGSQLDDLDLQASYELPP